MSFPRLARRCLHPAIAIFLVAALATAPDAGAQTVTTGAIRGVAADTSGVPIAGVRITMTHHATRWARSVVSDVLGAYRSPALLPGSYDLLAERLGYRPLVVLDVTVSPAAAVTLDLRLTPAEPPVTRVDTSSFVEGALHASLARGTWDPGGEVADLVDPLGRVSAVAVLASVTAGGLAMEGLPDRLTAVAVDGIPRQVAAHPGVANSDFSTLGLPFAALQHAEIASGTDVEWPGFGGGLISAYSARAPRAFQVRGVGDVGGAGLRGTLVVGGPVVPDPAFAYLAVDARRVRTRYAAPWPSDSAAGLAVAIARDSVATDLSAYLQKSTEQTDVISAFGRFDWEVAQGQSFAFRAGVTNSSTSDLALGAGRYVGLGSTLDARDISASLTLNSRFNPRVGAEASVAIDRSMRDYGAPALPGTLVLGGADELAAGADGALPGRFERNATRASGALFYRAGDHDLKVGVAATWASHDITYDPWRAGQWTFGSVADLVQGRGAFVQSVGGTPFASYSINTSELFAQDSWSPMGGIDMLFGVRLERAHWPTGGVTPNPDWQRASGIANQGVPSLKTALSPRVAFVWSAGPQRDWLLRGDAGVFAEGVDPSVLAEVLTHDGAAAFRRGTGLLGAWPGVPDSIAAPVTGPVLSLLNGGFRNPRTSRTGFSIARVIAPGTSLQLAGQYRHTDYLPRRSDLNLLASPQTTDQFGRPLYGTLQQFGSVLVAAPGSNRQFGEFDRVWAIDPSGYSDYWGVTVSLERLRERGLSVWASYTYSRTTDNTPGIAGSVPEAQLSPFAGVASAPDWRDGRSDLDVPHRVAVGAQWAESGWRLAGLVRFRSGLPFTPGFRDGVDANGDGAAGNDPAFVSDSLVSAAGLLSNSCLKQQVGHFAGRNSCRGPAVVSLDLRLVVHLSGLVHLPLEAVVDGLNLVSTNDGIVDRALYLVDPTRTLSTNGATGVVNVPLVANPDFGKVLILHTRAATAQAGLRFEF